MSSGRVGGIAVVVLVAAAVGALLVTAMMSGDGEPEREERGQQRTAVPTAGATPTQDARTATAGVIGFVYSIAGGCLPEDDRLMPGAERDYRLGIHEGVDFYDSDNCASIGIDTEVMAAKGGRIVRADLDYDELTADTLAALLERVESGDAEDPEVIDAFRGRQVWIDHGGGIVTRYAHLNRIADGIEVGVRVRQGQLIGYVGESGTPNSVSEPGSEVHLHFEIRIGNSYLGEGESPAGARRLYERAFSE